jgi:Icc-related predicted phosphoesterase
MKLLAVSDVELSFIYSSQVKKRFRDVDILIGCGDLPYYYLEYLISMLDRPLYYVRGNHASKMEMASGGVHRTAPWGAVDLHRRLWRDESGLLLAGMEGSLRYNFGPYQYTQTDMWLMVWSLVPGLIANRIRYGRYLDVFVSHAPPWKINDLDDLPHRGIKAFGWLVRVFQPRYHLHGHIHVYNRNRITEQQVKLTCVVNTYGFREIKMDLPPDRRARKKKED